VSRALTLSRTIVPLPDRERFFTRARELRAQFQSRGCQYWVFEDAALAGAFIEFAEGTDVDALIRAYSEVSAHGAAERGPTDQSSGEAASTSRGAAPERIYREVTL
jgi:hypothetical protein